jgi:hypothetical protein
VLPRRWPPLAGVFSGRRPALALRVAAIAMLVGAASTARAEGFVPRGTVHVFRCREDTLVTTTLTFDADRSDIEVNVADSTFTLTDVVRARWSGGPNDGLEWYFSDSDTSSSTANEILFHGFLLPGRLGGAFFPPQEEAPTQTNPQVWVPSGEVLADGYTWSWTGRHPFDDYAEVQTLDFQAAREVVDVPYRNGIATWKLSLQPQPAKAPFETVDGVQLDGMGRVVSGQDVRQCATPDPTEPRWITVVSSGRHRWCVLVQDAFVELVELTDEDGSPVVRARTRTISDLKRSFGGP